MEIIYHIDEMDHVIDQIYPLVIEKKCVAFYANMGCGKTTLIRALCKKLGVIDNVSSPTFSIINEYATVQTSLKVIHMDWYRLKNVNEAIDIGIPDYLDHKTNIVLIEWPQIAETLLPTHRLNIFMEVLDESTRKLNIKISNHLY